jgi:hypothetical protein
MTFNPLRFLLFTLMIVPGLRLQAWSPRFHESQTAMAVKLTPKLMSRFLLDHTASLAEGARGQSNEQVPTVEEVESQFQHIIQLSEEKRRSEIIVKELGVLAHQVQLLMDPSAIHGSTLLRDAFEAYGDEKLNKLALSSEPFWAVQGPLDPRPALLEWANQQFERHRTLKPFLDETTGKRLGGWDNLSLPYAELTLAYSNGVHATANLWILLWRAVGDQWDIQDGTVTPG